MAIANDKLLNSAGIRIKKGACVVIVRTEWNDTILSELEKGCVEELTAAGASVVVLTVPGAVEIPFAINTYFASHTKGKTKAEAFIALGCVIKGDTPHFDYVCQSVTQGVTMLNIQLPVPVIFGVLTVNTEAQAWERLGGAHGHKGREAAMAALKMITLKNQLEKRK